MQAGLIAPIIVPGFFSGLYFWLVFILVCFYEYPFVSLPCEFRDSSCSLLYPQRLPGLGLHPGVLSECLLTD